MGHSEGSHSSQLGVCLQHLLHSLPPPSGQARCFSDTLPWLLQGFPFKTLSLGPWPSLSSWATSPAQNLAHHVGDHGSLTSSMGTDLCPLNSKSTKAAPSQLCPGCSPGTSISPCPKLVPFSCRTLWLCWRHHPMPRSHT